MMESFLYHFLIFLLIPIPTGTHEEYIRQNAVRIQSLHDIPDSFYKILKPYKVIMLGETHGTNEAPEFIYAILNTLRGNKESCFLALEIPQDEQKNINGFLRTGDIEHLEKSPFFNRPWEDGRSSRAIARLLFKVRNLKIIVLCYDPPVSASSAAPAQDRDEGMARNIIGSFQKYDMDKVVVLSGSCHTRIVRGTEWDSKHRPMGYNLYARENTVFSRNDILAIRTRFSKGSAWTITGGGEIEAKIHHYREKETEYSRAVPWMKYFLYEPRIRDGHNATFFTREITHSLPLNHK